MSRVYLIDGQRGKRCTKCEKVKPVETAFYRSSGRGDGYQYQCKDCQKARVPEYRAQNADLVRKWEREASRRRLQDPERAAIHRTWQRERMRRTRGTLPENYVFERVGPHNAGPRVPSAPVCDAIETSGMTIGEIAARMGRDWSSVKRSLSSPTMSACTAREALEAIGLAPMEVGL